MCFVTSIDTPKIRVKCNKDRFGVGVLLFSSMLTIIVTGTSTGLGRDMALTLARQGHTVCATMRNAENRKEGVSMRHIAENEKLHLYTIDHEVTDVQSTAQCLGRCFHLSPNGKIDVLINNAGVGGMVEAVENTPIADFQRIMVRTNMAKKKKRCREPM